MIKLLAYSNDKMTKVLEYAEYGDLLSLLKELGYFEPRLARTYLAQILSGVEACHNLNVVHMDIKLSNLLIDSNYQIKICDFNLSHVLDNNGAVSWYEYIDRTPNYTAPELFETPVSAQVKYAI